MSEIMNASPHTSAQNTDDKTKITCHLVSLPKIVLTRIDEGTFPGRKNASRPTIIKKPVKRLTMKDKKKPIPSKISVRKILADNKLEKRSRGRPRKEMNLPSKILKPTKKAMTNKIEAKKTIQLKNTVKDPLKPENNTVKNMLKKTMIQKKSKIIIPSAKKQKLLPKKPAKALPPMKKKQISPKMSVVIPQTKSEDTDSSEDEFLYDELIEELESTPSRGTASVQLAFEKTTSITLKPNLGNKPPTIVKGGIIKRENLPPDLKPIASPYNLNGSKTENIISDKIKTPVEKKPNKQNSVDSPSPVKKPSPWPVSISSPAKPQLESSLGKGRKRGVSKTAIGNISNSIISSPKIPPKLSKVSPQSRPPTKSSLEYNTASKPVLLGLNKPKMGPKQTAKVTPLSKSLAEEDNLSDEYTEEETLENVDSEPEIISKGKSMKSTIVQEKSQSLKSFSKHVISPFDSLKDDEDPHLDLLRILTDDSDEPLQQFEYKDKNMEQRHYTSDDVIERQKTSDENVSSDSANVSQTMEVPNETAEEPPVRTIYDLMSEISLQYPSWNLHVIPESNAFCIAQVTKGRLGLPSLKKCIELDPVDYKVKVYIHQYHIKRFEGVYDSEESIIALIQEVNSIKA